jgi:uncharacterized membrane protein
MQLKIFIGSFDLKKLLITTAISLLVLDLFATMYFFKYWEAQSMSERMLGLAMVINGESLNSFDPDFRTGMLGLINQTIAFMLVVFLCINSFFYFYLTQKKKWAWQYAITYTSTASLFCLITALENINVGWIWSTINILSIALYGAFAYIVWLKKADCMDKGFRFALSQNPVQ